MIIRSVNCGFYYIQRDRVTLHISGLTSHYYYLHVSTSFDWLVSVGFCHTSNEAFVSCSQKNREKSGTQSGTWRHVKRSNATFRAVLFNWVGVEEGWVVEQRRSPFVTVANYSLA